MSRKKVSTPNKSARRVVRLNAETQEIINEFQGFTGYSDGICVAKLVTLGALAFKQKNEHVDALRKVIQADTKLHTLDGVHTKMVRRIKRDKREAAAAVK